MIPVPPALAAFAAKEGAKKALQIAKVAIPLLLLAAVAIYIAILRGDVRHLTKLNTALTNWQTDTVNVVRAEVPADRRKLLDPSNAQDEIRWLGREYRTHAEALRIQSERLLIAKGKAEAAQKGVREALQQAAQRDKAREATRRALTDPKRSTGLTEAEWGKL